jgi:pimeloyl-ACP methyl ester carboxylesterase
MKWSYPMAEKQSQWLIILGCIAAMACSGETQSTDAHTPFDAALTDASKEADGGINGFDAMLSAADTSMVGVGLDGGDANQDSGPSDAHIGAADRGEHDGGLAPDASMQSLCVRGAPRVVEVPTADGLRLVGDWYARDGVGRAVILLHMIPPHHDRGNYSAEVITALTERGFAVLNLDRRGGGDSPGTARDAYEGPKGLLDAKAAIDFLRQTGCVDMDHVAWVGASNGTTTVLDYAVAASRDDALTVPAAMVYLTGGAYTENQNRIADHRAALDQISTRFVFSTDERAWSAGFDDNAPDGWSFMEYDPGGHGTIMFGTRPESITHFAEYLDNHVTP